MTRGQTETFDIVTFTSPAGWQRLDSNGIVVLQDHKTNNNLTSFCQIFLFPGRASSGDASKDFMEEWNAKAANQNVKPATQKEKTPDGWDVITGYAEIKESGITYGRILLTASGFGKTISVMVNTAGGDYGLIIEEFFNNLNLDSKAIATTTTQQNIATINNQTNPAITINDYLFTAPVGWQVQNQKDQVMIQNMESGCRIQILGPNVSSGNLEQDARAVFDMMYAGWKYQQTGEQQYVLSKGLLPGGLMYCMMEAPMSMTSADGRYHLEDGVALVIKTGEQIVIIAVRHNSSFLAHGDCERKYETWRRFFNSFSVRNATIPKNTEEPSKRIVGVWTLTGSGPALGEYVFAANGNFQFGGAIGTSSTSTDYNYEYLHMSTYAFQGDGSYSIEGNQLHFRKRGDKNPEQVQFRFENVNHGGTGWKDRLYMLKTDPTLGSKYEVCYEKKDR